MASLSDGIACQTKKVHGEIPGQEGDEAGSGTIPQVDPRRSPQGVGLHSFEGSTNGDPLVGAEYARGIEVAKYSYGMGSLMFIGISYLTVY